MSSRKVLKDKELWVKEFDKKWGGIFSPLQVIRQNEIKDFIRQTREQARQEGIEEAINELANVECLNNHNGDECCWHEYDGELLKVIVRKLSNLKKID